jgi:hypothetical protein
MSFTKSAISLVVVAGCVGLAPMARAADPIPFSGQIIGEVKSGTGVAQMGASVFLYNRYDQLVRKVLSNDTGRFGFDGLTPDTYSIRVTLASYMPATLRNITVLAGAANLLEINLANVFSSIQLAPAGQARTALMSDDWKWVLRSSQATRPILRLVEPTRAHPQEDEAEMFSDTTGMVRLSAGGANLQNGALQQDLGTAFAVETSVYGSTRVRVSGNLGYSAASGLPSAGFRTTYMRQRDGAPGPQTSLTVRQIYFPGSAGTNLNGNAPVLRTASLSSIDSIELMDVLRFEYGANLESISLYGRMNYLSPFARATYNLGAAGALKVAFSSGSQPGELLARTSGAESDLNQDLAALSLSSRLSRRDNQAHVERTETFEASYELVDGPRKWGMYAYRDDVTNAAFLMSGTVDFVGSSDLLPDLNSRGMIFNAGDFQRTGFAASLSQALGDRAEIGLAVGRGGALLADGKSMNAEDGDGVRSQIHRQQRAWVTVRASGSLPLTRTNLSTSYGWTDFRALTPTHISLTGQANQQVGLNVATRQPLPGFGGMRMELNAEMRNVLAQGYLGVEASGGRRAVLTNSPRAVRGGVSFIF